MVPGISLHQEMELLVQAGIPSAAVIQMSTRNAAPALSHAATVGLALTLFLIGAGLSAQTLRSVDWRPLLQGVVLWGSSALLR